MGSAAQHIQDRVMRSRQHTSTLAFRYAAALLAAVLLSSPRLDAQPSAADDVARTLTLCTACHRDKFDAAGARNPHTVLDNADWQERTGLPLGCTNCHGDVSTHMRTGGGLGNNVFAFREETPLEQNATCLGCHRETHPGFDRSPHALAGLACTNCHSQHHAARASPLLRATDAVQARTDLSPETGICFDCHAETFSDFAFNERHRLREGVLECSSCHDPHAPVTRSLLGGFKQQQCIDCHTDKGGPFVFEHPASRTEGCTACHSPHGAPNRHMLTHQRVGELCFSCHAAVPQFHSGFSPVAPPRFGLDTQCTNCHSTIHGSNFDPFFLK
jgi:DmsE family decaheme c-type cytochrome